MSTQANFYESLYGDKVKHYPIREGSTLLEFLAETKLLEKLYQDPIVVSVNGVEIMEAEYGTTVVKASDVIVLQQFPRGPAFAVFMYWFAIASMVISAIYILTMPEPSLPETADIKEGSPTYSVSARGNRYRPGTKGPILYGRLRIVPDFDKPAFSTYDTNNEQTLHMLFRITQGIANVDLASIKFEDTPFSNFQDAQAEVVLPGQVPTLFPASVIESSEITNIELNDPVTAGYVVNPVNSEVNKIGIDLSSPSLFVQNKTTGDLTSYTVSILVQAQRLQANSDTPIGGWFNLGTASLAGDSQDALRRSFLYDVTPGRYQVRLDRLTAKDDSQYVSDNIYWLGLKGYEFDNLDTSPNTRLAVSIRSSQQLGNKALTNLSVIASRKLPIWDPINGWSPVENETASIGFALADLCRASYAGNRSDVNYDLQRCYELDQQLTPIGHLFHAYFDTAGVTVWDALIKAGTPGRITPIDQTGFFTFVRDEKQFSPAQSFTMRNIGKGSFRIQASMLIEETADSVVVVFQDEDNDYTEQRIPCALPDSPSVKPREVKLFGVTNATRAKELGMFMAATNRYRRRIYPFTTGVEGRIPFYGEQVVISHVLLGMEGSKELSGDITAYDGTNVIKISERWNAGRFATPYLIVIGKDGKPLAPTPAEWINEYTVRLPGFTAWSELSFDAGYKRSMFILGDGTTYTTKAKVKSIRRKGQEVEIETFEDDERVYDYGDDVIPPDPIDGGTPQSAAPVLSELTAHVGGTVEEPVVTLGWSLKNADKTAVEFSVNGTTFVPLGTGYVYTNQVQHRPDATKLTSGIIYYRLAAVNLFRGPWVGKTVDTSDAVFNPPLNPTNLRLRETFVGPVLKVEWDSDSNRHRVEIWHGTPTQTLKYSTTIEGTQWDFAGELAQQFGIGRSFTVRVYAIGANGKTSVGFTSLAVSNPAPPILANLSVVSFYGIASISFTFPSTVTDLVGISVWKAATSGFTPSASNLVVDKTMNPVIGVPLDEEEVAYIRIASVDAWGIEGLNYSGEYTVTGKGIDLTPIYDDLEDLQDELDALDVELGGVQTTLAGVQTDLNAAEADINSLEGKFPITSTNISDSAITTPKLSANSVTADKIVSNSITTDKLVAFAVTADKIAANAITADKIAANTITGDKIVANTISGDKLVANTITGNKIQALTITGGLIAAGTITTDKLSVAYLSALTADMGTLTAGLLKTTSSGSTARLEIDSNTNYPFWIGANGKDSANGQVFYDKSAQLFTIRDPNTGRRFEFQPSSGMPFWYGSGTKTAANGSMYFDTASDRLVLRNIQAASGYVTELQSNNWINNVQGFKLFSDGSAQFNNLVVSRPNVVASGTLNLPTSSEAGAHFGRFKNQIYSQAATVFVSRYNAPVYAQDPVDNYWYESIPAGAGFGYDGYYEFKINIPTSTFNPDEVGVVNGRMLVAQAVVVNSEYWYTGGTPSYGYEAPCSAIVTRVANYGASGSYIQLRIQVPVPFNRWPNITAIQIRSINWALSAFT